MKMKMKSNNRQNIPANQNTGDAPEKSRVWQLSARLDQHPDDSFSRGVVVL